MMAIPGSTGFCVERAAARPGRMVILLGHRACLASSLR
jgi:hypothetical protein